MQEALSIVAKKGVWGRVSKGQKAGEAGASRRRRGEVEWQRAAPVPPRAGSADGGLRNGARNAASALLSTRQHSTAAASWLRVGVGQGYPGVLVAE
jgi:hypothetical protein